jgi:hypothetical protein
MKDCLMIKPKKLLVCLVFIVTALPFVVRLAEATSMNFTVLSGQEKTETIDLTVEDHVVIKFTVAGSTDTTLYFSITYPNGTNKEFGKVGYFNYPFVCDAEGSYTLHFSNIDSTEDKLVALDYEIDHYIFGIPQMLFLVIIIAVVCVAAVAVFIFMGKPH